MPVHVRSYFRRCPGCDSDAAAILSIEEYSDDEFKVELRCGECEAVRVIIAPDTECSEWERTFYQPQEAQIRAALRRLEASNMKDWAATFIVALKHDAVRPEDF
jgi:hypothetical protein